MPTVRVKIQPDRDLEVSPVEARDLGRMGMLVESPAPSKAKAGQAPNTDKE